MSMLSDAKTHVVDTYFQAARRYAPLAVGHDRLRLLRNRVRYGVNSSYMFHAVEMEINSMCNRRCGYCPNSFARRPSGYMEEALFRKIIDELGAIRYEGRVSYHFYGEPLLDKRLPRFIEYTRERAPRAQSEIYSNGDFLTLESFRDYLRRGLGGFLITQHDNVIPPNLQRILDEATEEERRHLVIRFVKDRELINRSGLIESLGKARAPLQTPCTWPLSIMVIAMNGNVVLCCNDYFETGVVGNVREQSLREVWGSEEFGRFRDALARGDRTVSKLCRECDFVPDAASLSRIVAPPL